MNLSERVVQPGRPQLGQVVGEIRVDRDHPVHLGSHVLGRAVLVDSSVIQRRAVGKPFVRAVLERSFDEAAQALVVVARQLGADQQAVLDAVRRVWKYL